jgi:Cytochrome b5-like Heme/Steroid binding domain
VISDKQVLRLDKWIDRHPGGRLPVLHMVGRDATDQILVLSLPSSNDDSLEEMSLSVNLLIEYICTVTMLPRL